ncbi:hypothetical protein [Terrimonas pollutisoli]|uniref:hypothetical protein n=1 Tax=Terrimonas pollutisoli TaxID=3034147 RepID=UPI0023EB5F9C|nr:hypothetical protein [Terrimonas sp. H1YJ31]
MKLRERLLKEHSKTNCTAIVNWIGDSQQRFDELFDLFLNDEYRVVQRAAWPLSYAVIAHPKLIVKHFSKLFKNLQKPGIHDAVKRNTIRLLQDISIPKKFHGQVMNICFNYINSPAENAAVKAFALTVLDNLSKQYPEIKPELKTIIEDRWDYETAAFHSRARKILKKL